jgi:hypothetical protein
MRVRPIFWYMLAMACIGVLLFAGIVHVYAPASMQVRLDSTTPVTASLTTIELHLSDSEGLPIEQAQIVPSAHMTNMVMTTQAILVQQRGQGTYIVQLQLYMAGPWEIDITARADGFNPQQQILDVQVL